VVTRCSGIMFRRVWLFASLLFSLVGTASSAQTIKIRLVNSTNGSPVTNLKIFVFGISGKADGQPEDPQKFLGKHATTDQRLVTDTNGEAHFDLPNPAPDHFYIHAELDGPVWDCTCLVRVVTEEVLQKGQIIRNSQEGRSPGKLSTQPKPREIVFRLKPTPWWVRVVWPLFLEPKPKTIRLRN
jgi:hypothetical protein